MIKHKRTLTFTGGFGKAAQRLYRSRPAFKHAIVKTLDTLQDHPESPGLHREPIRNKRVRDIWSCRVTKDVRLIHQEPDEHSLRAVNVGHHVPIYRWAEHWSGCDDVAYAWGEPCEDDTGMRRTTTDGECQCQSSACDADTKLMQWLPRADADDSSFACIPLDELRTLGFDEVTAERIRRAPIDTDFMSFGLSQQEYDAIYALYDRCAPLSLEASVTSRDPQPIPRMRDSDDLRIAEAEQFGRMLELGLERYLTALTEDQRTIAHIVQTGLLLVRGCAGSGKTVVALHRLKYLADLVTMQPQLLPYGPRRVLYLCYNATLAHAARQMLITLYGEVPPAHIEVSTVDAWTRQYLLSERLLGYGRDAVAGRIAYDAQVRITGLIYQRLNRRHSAHSPLWTRFTPHYFADEICGVIQGCGIEHVEDYLATNRTGRGGGLSETERRLVWGLYQEYRDSLEQEGSLDCGEATKVALSHVREHVRGSLYEAVVVDEAQDLTPMQLRLAMALASQVERHVSIFADTAQVIYHRGFSWTLAELTPAGRQYRHLTRNYRNSRAIMSAAQQLLRRGVELDEAETPVEIERTDADEVKPLLLTCANTHAQVHTVCQRILDQISEGVQPQTIAMLAGTKSILEQMAHALRSKGVPVQFCTQGERISITQRSVKLLTMHSAKGLDFPHVYIVGLVNHGLPGWMDVRKPGSLEANEMQRRLLYTAMLRAGQTLVMTTVQRNEHPLLRDLVGNVCVHQYVSDVTPETTAAENTSGDSKPN